MIRKQVIRKLYLLSNNLFFYKLLISIFKSVYSEIEEKRKQLLIGEDKTNDQYKTISLFEEILFTNNKETKEFLKLRRIQELSWVHSRLHDICNAESEPYLLDYAIMMTGILRNLVYFPYWKIKGNRVFIN